MPAEAVSVIGASPGEAPGETWAQGRVTAVPATVGGQTIANSQVLLRYTTAAGDWQIVPVDDQNGSPISLPWAASEVTPDGGVVLAGTDSNGTDSLATRDPGAAFVGPTAPPTTGPDGLRAGETLYPTSGIPTMAVIDESGHVGVLIAPGSESTAVPGVLHYVDGQWSREPICGLGSSAATCANWASGALTVLALSASSAGNAWLLATAASSSNPLLFERETGSSGAPVWVQQQPKTWLFGSGIPPLFGETALPVGSGALLTASGGGVWIDFGLSVGPADTGSASVFVAGAPAGEVAGTWCYPTSLCAPGTPSLGATLPAAYGSFAWPGSSPTDPGARMITGLPEAAVLNLSEGGSSFSYEITGGDAPGLGGGGGPVAPGGVTLADKEGGAAFASPTEGWLGTALPSSQSPQVVQVTGSAAANALSSWPVPFRQPLLALVGAPGSTPGDGSAQALAVGLGGEIARYTPGKGWIPEFLYNSAGVVQTPTLRGVAWPTPERAFAVGDDGAMWIWTSETGLWEPDPAKPLNFHANLTAIAFSSTDPDLGYAVGKQGVLLAYDKTWTQQVLPTAVAQANFTSIAFAGGEAIASYRMLNPDGSGQEEGGILVNYGAGWTLDPSAQALLATLPANETVMSRVAGLPDGGAVAAGPGVVLERDSASTTWRFSSTPLGDATIGNIAALAAIRDGASVRALVSIDIDPGTDPNGPASILWQDADNPPPVAPGQPPLLLGPDPLPSQTFLLRETASGWSDQELDDYPNEFGGGVNNSDLAGWPDPVLALLVDPSGAQGWAVGGQTGGIDLQQFGAPGAAGAAETAGVMRYGPGPSPPASTSAPISIPPAQATFALGGGSGCAMPCSSDANQRLGPDVWLSSAIGRANQISGLRAFLYAGQRVSAAGSTLSPDAFDRELSDYAGLLSSGGTLPVYAAATPTDVNAAAGGAAGFTSILGSHAPGGAAPPGTPTPPPGTAAYAFDSAGTGGTVRVIVLDFSSGSLEADGGAELSWLAAQLDSASQAGIPAIVVGGDDITDAGALNSAGDGAAVQQVLLTHGASAYLFYDEAQQNVSQMIGAGANSIPAFGTGTLGYVSLPSNAAAAQEFLGASGFLLVSVNASQRNASTNRAPVTASLIPNAGQLALDATDGTLLRRSQVALFQGLARRPLGGQEWDGGESAKVPDPYTVLPETCLGTACGQFIKPTYTFSSSNPQIGDFVEHDPNSTDPRQILQDANGHPIPDPTSGLFCAYNPGTTMVTISSGGLSYTMPVTVQQGSVLEPCGTVTVTNPGGTTGTGILPTGVVPNGTTGPTIAPTPITVPPPHPPAPLAAIGRVPPLLPVQPPVVASSATLLPTILPVSAFTVRPLPPIGFGAVPAAVPLSVRVVEEQKEEEEAIETQQSFASYHPDDPGPFVPGVALLVLILAAGVGGTGLRRRRPRGGAAYARAEVRRERYRRW